MQEIIIVSVIAWWISEGWGAMNWIKWKFKLDRIKPFDCPLCLGFWLGVIWVVYSRDTLYAPILCSAGAMFISKIYSRL